MQKTSTQSFWEKEINNYCTRNFLTISKGKKQRLAIKMYKRVVAQAEPLDYEQGLKILGIYLDPTPASALTFN